MIDLYFWPTVNGKKIPLMLEEMGLAYNIKLVNIDRGDQFLPDFLRISPNNRMPAIVDHDPIGGGAPLSVFESGAIAMYLAEKSGRFWPQEPHKKYEVAQWVIWQVANQGPKFGEQNHFRKAAMEAKNGDVTYAARRFNDEQHRLYGVLNLGLYKKIYLAAGEYTIADMICYPWVARDVVSDEFPNVQRWATELKQRPAIKKAMAMGPEFREDLSKISPEEKARREGILLNQRARPVPVEW